MATFQKGEIVVSTVNTQDLEVGGRYIVVDVDERILPFGTYETVFVKREYGDDDIAPRPVVNAHLLLKRPEPPLPPKPLTAAEKIDVAWRTIQARLRELGAVVEAQDGGLGVKTVNGARVWITVSEDQQSRGRDSYKTRGTGKIRATVGTYGNKVTYPEGKNGLSIDKICTALFAQVNENIRARDKATKYEQARVVADELMKQNLPVVDAVNEARGLSRWGTTGAYVNDSGQLCVRVAATVTKEQAERLLDLVASFNQKVEA